MKTRPTSRDLAAALIARSALEYQRELGRALVTRNLNRLRALRARGAAIKGALNGKA